MANNCLVTELSAVVDNSSLENINQLVTVCTENFVYWRSSWGMTGDLAQEIQTDGDIYVNGSYVSGTSYEFDGTETTVEFKLPTGKSSFKVNFTNRYRIVSLPEPTYIDNTIKLRGLTYLSNYEKSRGFIVIADEGVLKDLAWCHGLVTLLPVGISGSIEDYVAQKRVLGATTGDRYIYGDSNYGTNNITYNGVKLTSGRHRVQWTASSITVS